MATIKPDTRMKDRLIKQEFARSSKREAHTITLKNLLASIPKIDSTVVQPAVDALMEAAEEYKASQPLVDPKGRRSRPSIAQARLDVAALIRLLRKAQDQLSNLSLDAIAAIGEVTSAPIGKMRSDIDQVRQAAQTALDQLIARPHRAADAARNVLAYRVAVVFADILKKKPSCTSDKQLKEIKPRGGAAYARVLRATLKVAGVTDYNQAPLITAGLALLVDKSLPSRV